MQAMASNERAITEREKEINEIVKSINGLAAVFKELQTMVIDQGTILDRIDYNIEQVNVHVEDAHGELQKVMKDDVWNIYILLKFSYLSFSPRHTRCKTTSSESTALLFLLLFYL